jgi:hypothetical protein
MSDSIAPQFKQMSELLIILNYEVFQVRPYETSLYNSILNADLLWRILASFNKNAIKNNKNKRYGGNGGMTSNLWLLLVKGRDISNGWTVGWHPELFLMHQRTEKCLNPKNVTNKKARYVFRDLVHALYQDAL